MNRTLNTIAAVMLLFVASGCYHAQVTTGMQPGTRVIEKPWAMGFLYGLLPPSTVNAGEECSTGVAIVETKLSFLNQLVSGITFGILSPMHITVTCAASGSASIGTTDHQEIDVPAGATADEIVSAIGAAADKAVESGDPVLVRFH